MCPSYSGTLATPLLTNVFSKLSRVQCFKSLIPINDQMRNYVFVNFNSPRHRRGPTCILYGKSYNAREISIL